ncbi:MAG TPA: DUF1206 domain-containing protein [Acidimicrobiia bacterium]|nr:DUF1206 domain-containing protein [Acidimicrobiia bacterium]
MPVAARNVAREVGDSTSLELLARAGLTAYGAIHILVGWLALLMAWGTAGESSDLSGALGTVATQPFGKIVLWLVAGGLLALALWQVSESIWGYRKREGARRKQVASWTKAVVYAALGVSAARVALGSGSSSSEQQQEATSGVLSLPAGRVLVVVAGVLIMSVGVTHMVKGVKASFLKEIVTSSMSPFARQGVTRLGQIGYVAKGLAVGGVGGLLTYATLTLDPQRQGLDGALQTILVQPFGRFLLTTLALGFLAFGLFAMLQARYRKM